MRVLWRWVLLAMALGMGDVALAQPSAIDRYREAPTVLAALHAPGQCLDMDNNSMGESVILWQCWPGWNQNFQTRPGTSGKVQITLGGYNCLTSPGKSGQRVTMTLCNPGQASQQWALSGTRILDSTGLCLNASGGGAGNGTWIIVWICTPGAPNEHWAFTTLRAEQAKAKQTGQGLPPGLASADAIKLGGLSALVEQDRPRFRNRALTGTERAEIARLMAPFRRVDVPKWILARDWPGRSDVPVPYSTIARLSALADSGDRDAMLAVLIAMRIALGDDDGYYEKYDPIDDGGAFSLGDPKFAWQRLHRLTMIWSAHYWQRHGRHRLAAFAVTECWPSHPRCGFTYGLPPEKKREGRYLQYWVRDNDGKHFYDILDIQFWPVDSGPEWREARFRGLIAAMQNDGQSYGPTREDHNWLGWYTTQTGQQAIYDNAWMTTWFGRNRYAHKSERQYAIAASRAAMERTWEQQFSYGNLSPQAQTALLGMSRTLGPAYLTRFASKYPVETDDDLRIICGAGSPDCLAQDRLLAQRQAEFEAATRQAEAERMAIERFGTGPLPSVRATIRNYDRNGNYVGTTVDTKTGAELSGAKPR